MKKIFGFFLIVLLLAFMYGSALALYEPVTISITPLDPITAQTVSAPVYAPNTLFCLRVDILVPRFTSTDNLTAELEVCGVDITEQNVMMADGVYYIKGVVRSQPASLTVRVRDNALKNAETAEEYYIASQIDRSVRETYIFGGSQVTEPNSTAIAGTSATVIPKTGDRALYIACLSFIAICVGMAWLIGEDKGDYYE